MTNKNLLASPDPKGRCLTKFEIFALATSVLVTAATLGWTLWRSRYGLDLTDESFYLVWISNPWIYGSSVSQFGFMYYPLYQLAGADVSLFRQTNILVTFGLAWILCAALFRLSIKNSEQFRESTYIQKVWISGVLASSSLMILVYYDWWLPTPSYNTLTFQALLLCGIGILLAERKISFVSIAGWILIGIAGWIAFMAKPTSAAALGLAVGCYVLLAGKLRFRLILISVATAAFLLFCSALVIDGSPYTFIERLADGVRSAAMLAGGHSASELLRLDRFFLAKKEKLALILATFCILIAISLSFLKQVERKLVSAAIIFVSCLFCFAIISGIWEPRIERGQFYGLLIWAAPMGGLLAILATCPGRFLGALKKENVAVALCFAMFPHVYAFGTNGNYWASGGSAALFWLLSGVAFLGPMMTKTTLLRTFLPMAVGAQVLTVVLLYVAMEHPYRQPEPLRQYNDVVQIGPAGSRLILQHEFASYFNELKGIAISGGFKSGTPVIDLTGHYPGALYSLGAKSIGQAWLIGGYQGSENLAIALLDKVRCDDISLAWVLTEPTGPRALSANILNRYGLDLMTDYVEVGRLTTPRGSYPKRYEQILYRPTRSPGDGRTACQQKE